MFLAGSSMDTSSLLKFQLTIAALSGKDLEHFGSHLP
jgi:hypothetical protein